MMESLWGGVAMNRITILAVGIAALGAISAAAEAADGCGRGWFYNGERCAQQEGHPGPRYYGPRERYYEPEAPRYYEPEADPRYNEPQPETRYYEPELRKPRYPWSSAPHPRRSSARK